MHRSVRDILAKIDTIFAAGSSGESPTREETARQLWDVLSALRGPDYESGDDKQATTCIIRAACFPKTFGNSNVRICIPASMNNDYSFGPARRFKITSGNYHFKNHAARAFRVLGLDWDAENTAETIAAAATPFKPLKRKKSARSQRDPSSKFRS